MNSPQPESPLWMRLYVIAEAMEDPASSEAEIIGLLRGLEEGFAETNDPAEQFPVFATLRLCRSVDKMLARLRASPASRLPRD
ncbi:hypothetical protein DWB85_16310 [Seongchinamella sediminis]|uniref:Uncharacterized protein n=1 Tax=Seongchinamella sediminis TaxID=2283635 RepID=A0A3L7DXX9_9GAMM|nr:hypothetical protein [Seongchinamella sediminis]RLQ20692.1 hypothetical protein DWB85_16310 [Seongchinamella sediminis]